MKENLDSSPSYHYSSAFAEQINSVKKEISLIFLSLKDIDFKQSRDISFDFFGKVHNLVDLNGKERLVFLCPGVFS